MKRILEKKDRILDWLPNTYRFSDDILIVTKGAKTEPWLMVKIVLEWLDKLNIRLKLDKCKSAEKNAGWLGFHLLKTGIEPINSTVQGIRDHWTPNTLTKTTFILGSGEPDE